MREYFLYPDKILFQSVPNAEYVNGFCTNYIWSLRPGYPNFLFSVRSSFTPLYVSLDCYEPEVTHDSGYYALKLLN